MKLLIKEYLAALKEREELDAILPDLLSEMGFHVYSRPTVGVRQHGVDLAAVGKDQDGHKKVFLFTVKSGDLTRSSWDGPVQSVRPSLNEILDSYIPHRIPQEYTDLPVAICVVVGGDIKQDVDTDLGNYEQKHKDQIEFQRWDGDRLANFILHGILGENVLSGNARTLLRKSVALLDEPEAAYQYFLEMLKKLRSDLGPQQKDRVTLMRQLNLCCWVLYAWAREADNLEAPYRCSELAMLYGWDIFAKSFPKSGDPAKAMILALHNLIALHLAIANEFAGKKLLPHAAVKDGLSNAVNSRFPLDVNLALFELLGRLSLTGIWAHYQIEHQTTEQTPDELAKLISNLDECADRIIQIINNNSALVSPIRDDHSIEIGLTCIFFALRNRMDSIRNWTNQCLDASCFALHANAAYPCILTEYHELAEHPKDRADKDYFQQATAGSTLIPTLCIWHKLANPNANFKDLLNTLENLIPHCTMQLWITNEESEQHLYVHSHDHGLAVSGLPITESCDELMDIVFAECKTSKEQFKSLSAIRLGYWPIVLAACRHHRVPLPLMFWESFTPLCA
ncbi:MAG: hypothetical protein OXC68_00905 [Aestuariivita sp.]|nr:hypothetical protein [Aestuariivita sp.]